MISWFRYVPHGDVARREAQGWTVVSDLGSTHRAWTVLMQWMGEGEPD